MIIFIVQMQMFLQRGPQIKEWSVLSEMWAERVATFLNSLCNNTSFYARFSFVLIFKKII